MTEISIEKPIDTLASVEANGVLVKQAGTNQTNHPLSPEPLGKMDAYWPAANYLPVGQIYLYDNPLLKEPLTLSHVKPLVVGHWGTTPGQTEEHTSELQSP